MTVRTKLLLAQLPLALSLVLVGLVSRHSVRELGHNSADILKDNYLSVLAAQRMRDAADTMADAALAYTRGRTPVASDAELERQRAVFERELAFQESNITEPGEREMTARVRGSWTRFDRNFHEALRLPAGDAERLFFDALTSRWTSMKSTTAPNRARSMALPSAPPTTRPSAAATASGRASEARRR